MIVKMVHNGQLRMFIDVVAQKLIDSGKAEEIVEITPTEEQLRALGIELEYEQPSAD